MALLGRTGELRDRQHRHLELAGEDLQPTADLTDLLDPVGARVVGAHQLQVVDDDQAEAAALLFLGVQPPRLRPQVEHAEVGGVVEPERRLLQLVAGAHHLGPVLLGDLPLAQLVAGDPRPAGDEALGKLDLRHLQREKGDRQLPLDRHVFGDVGDDRAVVDDDVVGNEIAQSRHIEVVGLFFADVLDRLDLVPPDVGFAKLLEGRRGERLGQLGDESTRG